MKTQGRRQGISLNLLVNFSSCRFLSLQTPNCRFRYSMYRLLTCYVIVSGMAQRNYISMVRHSVWASVSRVEVLFQRWTESTFVDTWLYACCWHVYVYYGVFFFISSGCIVQMFRYASFCIFHSGRFLFFPFFPLCWLVISFWNLEV
jgi:hypothetical protein